MAAAEIQIVNPANLAKIESFLSDPGYKEIIENSSTFNSRLCAERRMRMPFIDTQTGVAQSHCNLFMSRKQRMPGTREGQVYTYPAQRWRKARRQYLTMSSTRWGWSGASDLADITGEGENSSGIPGEAMAAEDSRDGSQTATKDDPKEWFYDELVMDEMEAGEDPDPESDEDYFDDTYANRRKRRGGATPTGPGSRGGRTRKSQPEDTPAKRGRAGRGRKRAAQATLPYEVPGEGDKPFGCELCGAKYKTRPGLTYHFTHTHKEPTPAATSDGDSRDSRGGAHTPPAPPAPPAPTNEYQDSYVTFLNNPGGAPAAEAKPASTPRRASPPPRPASADTSSSDSALAPQPAAPPAPAAVPAAPAPAASAAAAAAPAAATQPKLKEGVVKASPSPYCDFCLGDDRENKKTGTPEELVSCSDCGRSGKRRAADAHRHNIKLNGYVEIINSMSYPADAFDNFATQTRLLEFNDVYGGYPVSPPSSPRDLRSPDVPAVHEEHDRDGAQVPLAVHRVQMLLRLWHQRQRRPAALLRRLRPRLPHVLPGAAAGHAARGLLVLRALHTAVPHQVNTWLAAH